MTHLFIKNIVLLCVFTLVSLSLSAQDLIRKIPADANIVAQFQGKNVLKHLTLDELNKVFVDKGLFKQDDLATRGVSKLEDTGIDWNANAYLFMRGTDSVMYIGVFLPIQDQARFASFINPENKKITNTNGLQMIDTGDKIQVGWDKSTAYIITAEAAENFFSRPDIMEKYGLERDIYDYGYYEDIADAEEVYLDLDSVDTTAYADEVYIGDEALEAEMNWIADSIANAGFDTIDYEEGTDDEDYAYIDSMLERDDYSDDYYREYNERYVRNDSIKTALLKTWSEKEFQHIYQGRYGSYKPSKGFGKKDGNTIAQLSIRHFDKLISMYYPTSVLSQELFGSANPKLDYGIESIEGRIQVDKNKLKFVGDMVLDKEMSAYYKDIYKGKLNSKFYSYLDKDALGFFAFQMNTEAYIKHTPSIMKRVYKGLYARYDDAIDLVATILDVTLDEKAIGKVFKGDNLFVVSGVTKQEITYTDYDYDEDFNTIETQRTKTETVPQFLWMFSSEDTRIFEKLIQVGVKEGMLVNHQGLYELKAKKNDVFSPFVLIKDGIVFLGNDKQRLLDIQAGKKSGPLNAEFIKIARKNKMALAFQTKRVPQLLEELDIPVVKGARNAVDEMGAYGNLYMISSGVKGSTVSSEIGIEFPDRKSNALAFILDVINNLGK